MEIFKQGVKKNKQANLYYRIGTSLKLTKNLLHEYCCATIPTQCDSNWGVSKYEKFYN